MTHLLPVFAGSAIVRAGAVVPLTECGIAIVLLSKKWRNNAVIAAVVMHVFILLELGPVGHNTNSVIWSWNVTMICFLALLFWRSPDFSGEGSSLAKTCKVSETCAWPLCCGTVVEPVPPLG